MAPEDPELLAEWNKMQAELKELQEAQKRQNQKLERKLQKEYREKRKLYNDPYEVDPWAAMRADLKPRYDRGKEVEGVPHKSKGPYPYHQTTFAVIRELSVDEKVSLKEWMVRSYDINGERVLLNLEDTATGKDKCQLDLPWRAAIDILHRRCFHVAE